APGKAAVICRRSASMSRFLSTPRDRRPLRFRPALELLERRDLPAAATPHFLVADTEPNDTLDQGQPLSSLAIGAAVRVQGQIASATDVDWYHFDVSSAEQLTLTLSGRAIASLYETDALATPLGHRQILQFAAGPSATRTIDLLPASYDIAVSGAGNRYF